MQHETNENAQQHIISLLEERIESCEKKRYRNLALMNSLKAIRVFSSVLAVLFVALIAADGFSGETKFWLNMAAIVCTSLTALSSDLTNTFGFESRFNQNVRMSGELRTLKSQFELEISLLTDDETIDYRSWHARVAEALKGHAAKFDAEFRKAHKST